jgi:DNA-binding response OmpR family regulator
MKKKVLLIDDDPALQSWLTEVLPRHLFILETAGTGREGLEFALERNPDLILLDWNLPGWNGLDVCRSLRENKATAHIPLIMLTGYNQLQHKTAAFNLGVDDYIMKPFDMLELIARIKAVLRRYGSAPEEIVRIADVTLNLTTYDADVAHRPLKLTATEFSLLYMLMRNAGRILTRSFLLKRIWGYGDDIATRTVDVYIRRLRVKLGPKRAGLIESVQNMGYKFKGLQGEPPYLVGLLPPLPWTVLRDRHRDAVPV